MNDTAFLNMPVSIPGRIRLRAVGAMREYWMIIPDNEADLRKHLHYDLTQGILDFSKIHDYPFRWGFEDTCELKYLKLESGIVQMFVDGVHCYDLNLMPSYFSGKLEATARIETTRVVALPDYINKMLKGGLPKGQLAVFAGRSTIPSMQAGEPHED